MTTPDSKDVISQLERAIARARSEDAKVRVLAGALADGLSLPIPARVMGEPVELTAIAYDGNPRRGIAASVRKADGTEHELSLADVHTDAAQPLLEAYRAWLGMAPGKPPAVLSDHPIDLVVLQVKQTAARCRVPGTDRIVTVRAGTLYDIVPGMIVTLQTRKQWSYGGNPYLSGDIVSKRIDAGALGLAPLALEPMGDWDPAEQYWGEEDQPIPAWARPIVAHGRRPRFEMEQVMPGTSDDEDPIVEAVELKQMGRRVEARALLEGLLEKDLRCLDAHAHLGNLYFDAHAQLALPYYEMGVRIGELSLGPGFDGVLDWGFIDNRPFLRCMQGYGLCLWRLGRFEPGGRTGRGGAGVGREGRRDVSGSCGSARGRIPRRCLPARGTR